jgi:hypothetical protein
MCKGPEMSVSLLNQYIDLVERQFNEVSLALADGSPLATEAASERLQKIAVELVQRLDAAGPLGRSAAPRALQLRVKALAEGMGALRMALRRRSALVERSLQVVVPTVGISTYGGDSGRYTVAPRQTGTVRGLAA